jgi:hypothetical protein
LAHFAPPEAGRLDYITRHAFKTSAESDRTISLTPEEWEKMFQKDAGAGIPDMSDRENACLILEAMDYEQQLIAISGLLQHNKAADEQLEAERREIIDFIERKAWWIQQ